MLPGGPFEKMVEVADVRIVRGYPWREDRHYRKEDEQQRACNGGPVPHVASEDEDQPSGPPPLGDTLSGEGSAGYVVGRAQS